MIQITSGVRTPTELKIQKIRSLRNTFTKFNSFISLKDAKDFIEGLTINISQIADNPNKTFILRELLEYEVKIDTDIEDINRINVNDIIEKLLSQYLNNNDREALKLACEVQNSFKK